MQNHTILILDDDPGILDLYRKIFSGSRDEELDILGKAEGFASPVECLTFADPMVFLDFCRREVDAGKRYPLCVIDMRMPLLNGLETARRLREIDEDIGIVICTAFSDTGARDLRARISGNVFLIRKPFVPDEFHLLAHSLVSQWNIQVSLADARKEIAMQLENHRLVLEATKVGVWQWDLAADRITFGDRWPEISGRLPQGGNSVTFGTWLEMCHPEDLPRVESELTRTFNRECLHFDTECRILHQDGHWVWVRGRGKVVSWSPGGKPLLIYGTMEDVTERVNREAKAARQIQRVMLQNQLLSEIHLSPMLAEGDVSGLCREIVRRLGEAAYDRRICFWLSDQADPRLFLPVGAGCGASPVIEACPDAATIVPHLETEKVRIVPWSPDHGHGARLDATIRLRGKVAGWLRFESGEPGYVWEQDEIDFACQLADQIGIGLANGERHRVVLRESAAAEERRRELLRINAELEEAIARANDANRAKSDFLANMCHEIRTPINGVLGMSTLLMETPMTREQEECAEMVHTSARALLSLINDILDFSKIEAGLLEIERVAFSLADLLRDVRMIFRLSAEEKGIGFSVRCDERVPDTLMGDPGRLRQILINLVGNAIKFTARGSVALEVEIENPEDRMAPLRFTVTDTGIGIPKDKHDMIFASFTQVDSSTARMFGGTGLGLAISKQLVSKMGGMIGLSSTPGKGSVFWFTARLDVSPHAVPGGNFQSMGIGSGFKATGAKVLVVEDNAVNQKVARGFLRHFGLEVDIAGNGWEAVEMAATTPYALIFMDVQMPGLNGYDTTREIRKIRADLGLPRVPIVAMTANAMADDRDRCLRAGMDDYIPKPFSPESLEGQLRRWLGDHEVR